MEPEAQHPPSSPSSRPCFVVCGVSCLALLGVVGLAVLLPLSNQVQSIAIGAAAAWAVVTIGWWLLRGIQSHLVLNEALRSQQRSLRVDERRLNLIVSQLPALIWTTDADLCVMTLSGGALQDCPICPDRVIGRPIAEMFGGTSECANSETSPCLCDATAAHRRAMLGNAVGFDLRDFRGSGRDLDVVVEPLLDKEFVVTGCLGLAVDVTERRKVRQAEHDRRHLQDAVSAMEQVLTVIGHELRTPLAALRAMSEYIISSRDSEDTHSFVQSIHDEIIRLSTMVNALLDAASIHDGAVQWTYSSFELEKVCREAIQVIEPLVDPQEVTVSCNVAPDLTINGDADAIRRLIINLLTNAHRHTDRGRICIEARRTSHDEPGMAPTGDGHCIDLVVSDTGSGIPEHLADKLGVPFALNAGVIGGSRGSGECSTAQEGAPSPVLGSGFGLAIASGIAKAHGGSLQIASEVGRGTTVTVCLRADLKQNEMNMFTGRKGDRP